MVHLIQKLSSLSALCPNCHKVKHIGQSSIIGLEDFCIYHLCKINKWSKNKAEEYIKLSFELWDLRSRYKWTTDLSYLDLKLK